MASYRRTALKTFSLANNAYIAATVTFYTVDIDTGERTSTLATLWDAPAAGNIVSNPYTLDSAGKTAQPLYFDTPVIAVVGSATLETHTTGIELPATGQYRGDWIPFGSYLSGDMIADGADGADTRNIYIATSNHTSTAVWADDVLAYWELIVDVAGAEVNSLAAAASAAAALVSENAAEAAQTAAENAAAAAAASAASNNIEEPTASKYGAILVQNSSDDGYVRITSQGTAGQALLSGGADAIPYFGDAYTNEMAQDAVGGILSNSSTINFTYDDAGAAISADVNNASITEAMMSLADNTTHDVSTSAHGWAPKAPNDTTKFLRGDGTWAVPANAPVDIAHITGRKYHSALAQGEAETNVTVAANRLYFLPFYIPVAATYAGVGAYRSGAGGSIRFGLYADNGGEPAARIEDFGEDTAGSAGNVVKTFTRALTAGWYWFGVVFSAADSISATAAATSILGSTTDYGNQSLSKSLYMAHAYGALPAAASGLTYATTNSPLLSIYK